MRPSLPVSLIIVVATTLAGASCDDAWTITRTGHCAQQAGDAWCAEQYPDGSRSFCRRGYCNDEAGEQDPTARDGCVAARPADDACYSPCGHETTVLEDHRCVAFDASESSGDPGSTEGTGTTSESETSSGPAPECGNGIVDDGESCDDGQNNGAAGSCAADCQGPAPWCGDGLVQVGESCDDGNLVEADGCNTDCRESGSVLWERTFDFQGDGRDVGVGADGGIYVAGRTTGVPARAWAARLAALDGSIVWTYAVETPAGSLQGNSYYAVDATDDVVAFAGRHADRAHVVLLDASGTLVGSLLDAEHTGLTDVAVIDGGYLTKSGNDAIAYDDVLSADWALPVGSGLAYAPGDNVALASYGAGFVRFTLWGTAFPPVEFPLQPGLAVESRGIAWDPSGDVIVMGRVTDTLATEAFVARASSAGQLRWIYGPPQLENQSRDTYCLAVDSEGSIVVGGWGLVLGAAHPFLMKLSTEGNVLWLRQVELAAANATANAAAWGCTTTPSNEIVAVGEADGDIWAAMLTP